MSLPLALVRRFPVAGPNAGLQAGLAHKRNRSVPRAWRARPYYPSPPQERRRLASSTVRDQLDSSSHHIHVGTPCSRLPVVAWMPVHATQTASELQV